MAYIKTNMFLLSKDPANFDFKKDMEMFQIENSLFENEEFLQNPENEEDEN